MKHVQTMLKALQPRGTQSGTSSSNSTANLTATLTAAGVSSSQITTIEADLQNLKNAMTTTDPTLSGQDRRRRGGHRQGRRTLHARQ